MTAQGIREFFQKGLPVEAAASPQEERYRIMVQESKRWHTDKLYHRFGRELCTGEMREVLNTVTRVVLEEYMRAKMNRRI